MGNIHVKLFKFGIVVQEMSFKVFSSKILYFTLVAIRAV